MDPSRGEGGGGEGDGPGAPRAGGLGRAQMLRNLSLRTPGERESSSTASTGRGALLRGMSADSTVGESSVTSQGPLAVAGGRGALLRTLSGAGGATSQSSASSSSVALSRQELMAKLNKNRAEAAVLPKPIGRAGLVPSLRGRGSSGAPGSGSGGSRSVSVPGPVQPVPLLQDQQDQQVHQKSDIANVEDAVEDAVEPSGVDRKVAEAAAALERITVEEPAKVERGSAGKTIKTSLNYIRLERVGEKKNYEYEVKFQPTVDSRDQRFKLIRAQSEVLGPVRNFDGVCLSLPFLLKGLTKDLTMTLQGQLPETNTPVQLLITLKHAKPLSDPSSIQFFNVLFRRIMGKLKMVEMNRNFYQPADGHLVPQHKLEIWPGYVTAVQEYEGGLMLNLDVSHKVLRTQTALELMKDIAKMKSPDGEAQMKKGLMGAIVLTRYNNKSYRVDDLDFGKSPTSTFLDHTGREKSFMDYYREQYNIQIKDTKQPLLLSRSKRKTKEEEEMPSMIYLIPELCTLTGLTDQMKADFKVMKDVAQFTRVTPTQRQEALRKFLKNVNDSAEASAILLNWNLRLAPECIQLEGRHLAAEKLLLGKNTTISVNAKADWGRESTSNHMLVAVDLKKWAVLFVNKNQDVATSFTTLMNKLAPKMGMKVAAPDMKVLPNDRTETYLKVLRETIKPDVQIVVLIMPSPRDDRYSAVKMLCNTELPVPSQVINYRTLSNEKKASSVVQKVALQINCKLGGQLWGCQLSNKFGNLMVVGVDVFHDPSRRGSSIAGVVSSTNQTMSSWWSQTAIQTPGQEMVDCLKVAFVEALKKFYEMNHVWPDKVIIFRDGVSDSQLDISAAYEARQFQDSFQHVNKDYKPGFGFLVVQKRINTRIFHKVGKQLDNPPPGSVLDHTVTRRKWHDFFLVSQHVGQGTVSPTHYVLVADSLDSLGLPVDAVQRISYKLTHMYFNWPGTVRVPAPCQYAHKLAYQVGEHIHKEPSKKLSGRLFYL